MVHYAIFLNRTSTHQFFPYFEIIYVGEFITILADLLLSPILAWIIWSAQPLHRNLRHFFIYCCLHLFLVNLSRIPLLLAQQFVDDFEGLFNLTYSILFVAIERLIATQYWSWYEKQERNTLLLIIAIISIFEMVAIVIGYHVIFLNVLYQAETVKLLKTGSIIVSVVLISAGFLGYFCLLYYNHSELRKLRRRADPNFGKYSLSRTYQLRENVVIMKMIVKLAAPAFMFASPIFVLRTVTYMLNDSPAYDFYAHMLTAIIDLWAALACLNAQLIFPFFDYRFRQPAARITIFRWIIEKRGMQTSTGRFVRKHLTVSPMQTSDYYFQWLGKDLNRERPKSTETNRKFVVII